jgi:hypothetical protein
VSGARCKGAVLPNNLTHAWNQGLRILGFKGPTDSISNSVKLCMATTIIVVAASTSHSTSRVLAICPNHQTYGIEKFSLGAGRIADTAHLAPRFGVAGHPQIGRGEYPLPEFRALVPDFFPDSVL